MNLPAAPKAYDPGDLNRTRELIRRELEQTFKRGGTVEIANGRLVMTDRADGSRAEIVLNAGVLTPVPVTI